MKQYIQPDIRLLLLEDLLDVGVHMSVGNGEQLARQQYDDYYVIDHWEQDDTYEPKSAWDE